MAQENQNLQPDNDTPAVENQPLPATSPVEEVNFEAVENPVIPGPAIPENQLETQQALQENEPLFSKEDEKQKIKEYRQQMLKVGGPAMSDIEIKRRLLGEDRKKQQSKILKKQDQIQEKKEESQVQLARVKDSINSLQQDIEYAKQIGVSTDDLEAEQQKLVAEQNTLETFLAPVTPATEQDVVDSVQPTKQDVIEQNEVIRKTEALKIAEAEQANQAAAQNANKIKIAAEQKQAEDDNLKDQPTSSFFGQKTTGRKITAALALAMGALGSALTGQRNTALQIFNKAIDDDFRAQKLSADEAQARKEQIYKNEMLNLKKQANQSSDQLKKIQMGKLITEMQVEADQIANNRLTAKRLASGEGLTQEEVLAMDPKRQERMLQLGDGKFYPSTGSVTSINKLREEIPQTQDAIRGISRLKEILSVPGSELNPKLRAESATIRQSLKGALRLQLFGPGVMTDFENRLADKIIGDPAKIMTLDTIERTKLDTLLKKVQQGARDKLRLNGINLPPSKNELRLKDYMNKAKIKETPQNRAKAINAMIQLGRWNPEDDTLF